MRESWRWFGPNDPVTINDIRQTGATDVVSALHTIPTGDVWSIEAIRQYQALIENCEDDLMPLKWSVVESIPVHEDIKLRRPGHQKYIDNWIESMENLAKCGIKTICYNFMPVIDWTRTDLKFKLPNGAYALRFDQKKFAAFDLFILQRDNAEAEYSAAEIEEAKQVFEAMSEADKEQLTNNIIAGLPGKMTDAYGLDDFRAMLSNYKDVTSDTLRESLFAFLAQVLPRAEAMGVKLAIHPDDPPRDMLGLPRIICTADDLDILFNALPCPSNGITLCVGTFSSRPDNNLPAMAKQFGPRIHFSHLRGVTRDPNEQRTFYEASHLDSDIDMIHVVKELLNEENRRRQANSLDQDIFIRPDHGHQMMDDIGKTVNPGYSGIGRLKGLAEVRGVIRALSAQFEEQSS
ncbi:mannonate dehydratase [Aliiglaciecola sp. 2_MG-2023]|uniref:mannonate dehydratase n=1 Tax=unclassified Aliiglaciecola TaxID=2593648 RepID=UPI0026E128BE|nr:MULTISPECIES: mannonate dehydratase [unclassified Aliiglaciecola]MDO6709738.1 mannonate dehydratase [Aliiglaciecola sp. 2_MG-2023]MDO6750720.1 mannonate dehydratase [Aliiglaciecola sp. 1_MG-2023]